ncbi:MAG: hypothetical protein L6R36_008436, partial [Xanthoria steineri]
SVRGRKDVNGHLRWGIQFPCKDQVKPRPRRIEEEDAEEDWEDGENHHQRHQCPMNDHPPTRCKAGQAHVEGDDGHLDESDSLVENNRPDAADVLEDAVLLIGDIVHVLSVATVRDARKTEGRPRQRQCLQPVSEAMPRRIKYWGRRYKSE